MKKSMIAVAMAAMTLAGTAWASVESGAAAPDFTLMDASGKEHTLSNHRGQYVVLEWINYGCPFVVKHYSEGHMQALQKAWGEKEVVWYAICSSAPGQQGHYSAEQLGEVSEKQNFSGHAYLIDEDGTVGRQYGARTTPHMFVIDPEGTLVYQGAIDSVRSTRASDIEGATNHVVEALKAAMAGEPVDPNTTVPYGCSVKYAN